ATISGSSGDISYVWTDSDGNVVGSNAAISDLEDGTYTLIAIDENGCEATCSATVSTTPCCNVTDPGEIGGGGEDCGEIAGPIVLGSVEDPSGGLGDLEIIWMTSDTLVPNIEGNPYWSQVPDEFDLTLTIPGPIT
ncbi:MAG: hypothetical protein ABR574_06505, partial [Cryomorphaceae bacterium]